MTIQEAIREVQQSAQPYRCAAMRPNKAGTVIYGDEEDVNGLATDDILADDWVVRTE